MSTYDLCLFVWLVVQITAFLESKESLLKTYENNRLQSPESDENLLRIFGGHNVMSMKKYPYMAYILMIKKDEQNRSRGYKCGGTILNRKYILTAAHCMKKCEPVDMDSLVPGAHIQTTCWPTYTKMENIEILVGEVTPALAMPKRVEKYFIHPKYNNFDFANQCYSNYDIAILELKTPLEFNENTSSVTLPPLLNSKHKFNLAETKCDILGWGITNIEADTNQYIPYREEILKVARVNLINNQKCIKELGIGDNSTRLDTRFYKDKGLCRATQLCTIDPKNRNGFCGGDSGGPLMCGGLQVGVISWDEECAGPHIPHIYTKVDVNLKWIHKIISRT